MNGCRSTIGAILMKFEITPPNGCGDTTMNVQIWHWAALPLNSGLPWPHSSTSQSNGLRGDYQCSSFLTIRMSLLMASWMTISGFGPVDAKIKFLGAPDTPPPI